MNFIKLFDNKLNLLFYVFLPLCLGLCIVKFDKLLVIGLFAVGLFFYLKPRWQFYIFFLTLFYPLVLTVGPINELPISFVFIPLFFCSMLAVMMVQKQKIDFSQSRLFFAALLILCVWMAVGYARNSFSFFAIDFSDNDSKMIARAYVAAVFGVLAFFGGMWYFSQYVMDEQRILKFFIVSALIFGLFRFACYFFNYVPPMLSSGFRYASDTGAVRLGGVDACMGLGIPALLAYSSDRLSIPRSLLLIVFFVLGILGGGRTLLVGLLASLIISLWLLNKKFSAGFLLALGVVIITMALLAQYAPLPNQVRRMSGLTFLEKGSLVQEDPARARVYDAYWNVFLNKPFWGKGIGMYEGNLRPSDFVNRQLMYGGHGSYLAILCLFGVGGAAFLGIMLFGGIMKACRLLLYDKVGKIKLSYPKLTTFILLYLITTAFYYVTSKAGYKDLTLYFVMGMLLGIICRQFSAPSLESTAA